MNDIDNTQDIMDSRDVIARIDELREERDDIQNELDECHETLIDRQQDDDYTDLDIAEAQSEYNIALKAKTVWADCYADELKSLEAFAAELQNYGDWEHGETLIRDSYFSEYAEELANDIGAVNDDHGWPLRHIDWEAATNELKMDYTTGTFDGVEYWMRA